MRNKGGMTPVLCGMLCTGVVSPVRTGRRRRSGTPRVPEFTATVVRNWLKRVGVRTLFIEPGSPWENGYVESFNSKLRDELLNSEIFYTLREAKVFPTNVSLDATTMAKTPSQVIMAGHRELTPSILY